MKVTVRCVACGRQQTGRKIPKGWSLAFNMPTCPKCLKIETKPARVVKLKKVKVRFRTKSGRTVTFNATETK